eukprot:3483234-Pleurochrysis_carterae.AAC.1
MHQLLNASATRMHQLLPCAFNSVQYSLGSKEASLTLRRGRWHACATFRRHLHLSHQQAPGCEAALCSQRTVRPDSASPIASGHCSPMSSPNSNARKLGRHNPTGGAAVSSNVLAHLTSAVFRDADTNGDGVLSPQEITAFLARHRLKHVATSMSIVLTTSGAESLSVEDFKAALLRTQLVTFDKEATEYGVHRALEPLVSAAFFDHADANKDGSVTLDEVEQLFADLGVCDAAGAESRFLQYTGGKERALSKRQFARLLTGEGLMRVTLSATQYCRGGI